MKKLVKKISASKKLVAFYMGECKQGACNGR